MSEKQLAQIQQYLDGSKNHLESMRTKLDTINSVNFTAGRKYAELQGRQEFLERAAEQMSGKEVIYAPASEFGQISWLIAGGATLVTALGTWAYKHFQETKKQSEYLDCLEKRMSPPENLPPEEAAKICSGKVGLFADLDSLFPIIIGVGGLTLAYYLLK